MARIGVPSGQVTITLYPDGKVCAEATIGGESADLLKNHKFVTDMCRAALEALRRKRLHSDRLILLPPSLGPGLNAYAGHTGSNTH